MSKPRWDDVPSYLSLIAMQPRATKQMACQAADVSSLVRVIQWADDNIVRVQSEPNLWPWKHWHCVPGIDKSTPQHGRGCDGMLQVPLGFLCLWRGFVKLRTECGNIHSMFHSGSVECNCKMDPRADDSDRG